MLSGGERGRLALAKLALQDTNLLLLDEPTNHLDIPSQEILQSVLDSYKGTILLVSHDRYLVDALATQIWEINPDESQMITFDGTYSQMKEEREKEAERLSARQAVAASELPDSECRSQTRKEQRDEGGKKKDRPAPGAGKQNRRDGIDAGKPQCTAGESVCEAGRGSQDRDRV